jgi:MFS transporter, FLVCR family, MFS-domain-containing protein 7
LTKPAETRDPYRWVVLLAYTLVAFSTQLIWLNFSGIAEPQVTGIFNTSIDQVGYLAAFWPLVFIPLSLPTGLSVDRWGFRRNVVAGSLILTVFSWLRLTAGLNFGLLLLYQTLAGVGQPFVYNAISKLAGSWFPKGEQTLANGIGTMGQLVGMITALVVGPIMVPDSSLSELQQNMLVFSALVTVSFALFAVLAREKRGVAEERPRSWGSLLSEMKSVIRMRNIVVMMMLFFVGVGIFSGLIQWTESILSTRGVNSLNAGLIGAVLLVSGIVGMVAVSYIADKYSMLKRFVTINTLVSAVFLFVFGFQAGFAVYALSAVLIGFFLLSLAPIGLQISLETVGEARSGSAASIVWLASQVGALILIVVMSGLSSVSFTIGSFVSPQWFVSVLLTSVLALVAFGLSFLLKDTRTKDIQKSPPA